MTGQPLIELERDLQKVPGVRNVRVVGSPDRGPSEIHIVATPERPPKQLVRDVQSLAAAGLGILIDHRIVSVVQLADGDERLEETRRPALDSVIVMSRRDAGWVRVSLSWPDGRRTEGEAPAGASREVRARATMTALLKALEPALERMSASVDVQLVSIQRVGATDAVFVRATLSEEGSETSLVGCAEIYDDVATAAARALMQAINRKLR